MPMVDKTHKNNNNFQQELTVIKIVSPIITTWSRSKKILKIRNIKHKKMRTQKCQTGTELSKKGTSTNGVAFSYILAYKVL